MHAAVGQIFLYTEHLDTIVPFYRDVLALPVKSYEPGHALWLETRPVPIVLHAPEAPWYAPPYKPAGSGVLLWLQVEENLEEVARTLQEQHADLLTPVMHGDRRDLLLLRDPEGRRVGLYRERIA